VSSDGHVLTVLSGRNRVTVHPLDRPSPTTWLDTTEEVFASALSPDARWLVTGEDREYRSWEVGSWRPGRRIERAGEGMAGPLAFSADGQLLALAATRFLVQLVDVSTGDRLASLQSPDPILLTWLSFSPDGQQLAAAGQNHTFQLWNLGAIRRQLADMGLDWSPLR
jgi:WD40 repeat protein